jgi:hypothetical protein
LSNFRTFSSGFLQKAFTKTKTELGQTNAVWIIAEREASLVRNAVIFAVNVKTMQLGITPTRPAFQQSGRARFSQASPVTSSLQLIEVKGDHTLKRRRPLLSLWAAKLAPVFSARILEKQTDCR